MKSGIMKSLAINRLTVSLNHLQNMLMNSKAKKNQTRTILSVIMASISEIADNYFWTNFLGD